MPKALWHYVVFLALSLDACASQVAMGPDREEFRNFAAASAGPTVEVTPLVMGTTKPWACAVVGAASCLRRVEIVYAAYVVRHPKATFLIDAGLSAKVKEDVARFSFVPRQAFAFDMKTSLAEALAPFAPVDFVLLTHAHWDHTSGLQDLVAPKVLMTSAERDFVEHFHGKEPTVVPAHFAGASIQDFSWDGPAYENFAVSHDLFGDGAVVTVPLPGHTPGSIGVFVRTHSGRRLFFVGDAVWNDEGVTLASHRSKLVSDIVDNDIATTSETIWRLHHLQERYPDLIIVAAHDGAALGRVRDVQKESKHGQ